MGVPPAEAPASAGMTAGMRWASPLALHRAPFVPVSGYGPGLADISPMNGGNLRLVSVFAVDYVFDEVWWYFHASFLECHSHAFFGFHSVLLDTLLDAFLHASCFSLSI